MEPIIVPRSDHPISRRLIDPDAVKVLYRLHRAGYQAYLVGGGVRDLMLERNPKDFDISTDAHPHQVKRLFRNCRLIGRRFRLAHVHFGDKILEVSTFRKRTEPEEGDDTSDLLIRSDNTFGTAEEDALRRDFTINGLFYDISTFSLIDYVGGLEDLKERLIRTIGSPDIRFREDPVRMIRAVKFAARLDFGIEEETYDAIIAHREEILKSARPRLLEEVYRLLGGGAAVESFRLLYETGLLDILIPSVAAYIESHGGVDGTAEENPLWGWLGLLDARKAAEIPTSNPMLLGALLAEINAVTAADAGDEGREGGWTPPEETLRPILADLVVPRRDTEKLLQILRMQRRFTGGRSRRFSPRAFVTKSYFPDAFQFFEMSVKATGRNEEALARWRTLADQAPPAAAAAERPRRRRRRRRRGGDRDADFQFEDAEDGMDEVDFPEDAEDDTFEDASGEGDDDVAEEQDVPIAAAPEAPPAPRRAHEGRPSHPGRRRPEREPRHPRSAPQESAHPTAVPPKTAPPAAALPKAAPPAAPPPARTHAPRPADDDDDEDSQIRFLGWSDQPAILNPRAHAEEPVPNPYLKDSHRAGRGGERRHGGIARPSGGGGRGRPSGQDSRGPGSRGPGSRGPGGRGPGGSGPGGPSGGAAGGGRPRTGGAPRGSGSSGFGPRQDGGGYGPSGGRDSRRGSGPGRGQGPAGGGGGTNGGPRGGGFPRGDGQGRPGGGGGSRRGGRRRRRD